ncbi:hypothetical protein RhiirA1_422840 [Rhizophagus irregularis]|nr:hypothetical protein RirG_023310 [Rhizophagus irregularis DAOM 197198w]PKC63317.1 hypothetical protein RhiirA1_422840 [Rhizophagus irregularis]UZO11549.1 hypothetical protein OCT59_003112 [Rhizophagus irregularis]
MGSFDHERIQNGRTLGSDPIVVGSVPPADSLWDLVRAEGFHVKTFPRNDQGFEKMVDMQIGIKSFLTMCLLLWHSSLVMLITSLYWRPQSI